jgi:hypothetical protein
MEYASRSYRYEGATAGLGAAAPITLQAGSVYRFFLGRDAVPVVVDPPSFTPAPSDPFWTNVLVPGRRPTTLRELLDHLAVHFPVSRTFVVGDGGQIPFGSVPEPVQRNLRLIVAWSHENAEPSVMASTAPRLDDAAVFLQVIAWDPEAGAFQFYDRRQGAWSWVGSSYEALAADTRGHGPFDSHVNGALNMKELKPPWLHWHSMAAEISDDVLAPQEALRSHPLWRDRRPGNEFEISVARPGIERWTRQRLRRSLNGGRLHDFPQWFRQLVQTTTVNLASSSQESRTIRDGVPVSLPLTFFINRDALFDQLGIEPDIAVPSVDGGIYQATIARYRIHLTDGTHRFDGDTHFAFAVPEPAYEDLQVLRALLEANVLSPRFAAALLMVDFCNPVFSARRDSLQRHAPTIATLDDPIGFEHAFVAALRAAGDHGDSASADAELLANLALSEDRWRATYAARIEAFAATLHWKDVNEFAPIIELADSRRREFRRRPLAEFSLTLPFSTIPSEAPFLEFIPEGRVRRKP